MKRLVLSAVLFLPVGLYLAKYIKNKYNKTSSVKNTEKKDIKLVVLDVSGVLCAKDDDKNREHGGLIKIDPNEYYNIFLRPLARQFIANCLANYDVGIFSSTTYPNVIHVLKKILSVEEIRKLKFIWTRDRCILDPDYGDKKEITEYDTVKMLDSLVKNPSVNYSRKYKLENIIMIDDSERKMRFNDPKNYFLIKKFDFNNQDIELEAIFNKIQANSMEN